MNRTKIHARLVEPVTGDRFQAMKGQSSVTNRRKIRKDILEGLEEGEVVVVPRADWLSPVPLGVVCDAVLDNEGLEAGSSCTVDVPREEDSERAEAVVDIAKTEVVETEEADDTACAELGL